jgi:hypothetical protein
VRQRYKNYPIFHNFIPLVHRSRNSFEDNIRLFVRVGVPHTEIKPTLVRVALTLYFYQRLFGENETAFRKNETLF